MFLLLIVGLSSYLISMGSNHAEVEGLVGNSKTTSPLPILSLATLILRDLVGCWPWLYTAVSNIKET